MNKFLSILVIALIIPPPLFSCTQRGIEWNTFGTSFTYPMLQPGDKISDMVITTGIEDAFPLWAVCSPKKVNDHSIIADCGELSYDNLAIGHTLGVMDLVAPSIKWEDLNWEMFVDGNPIDLSAFGAYEFVHPDIPSKPSPFREVFKQLRVWDVVLVNPTLGMHRIDGQVQNGDATYTWAINFTIPAPSN